MKKDALFLIIFLLFLTLTSVSGEDNSDHIEIAFYDSFPGLLSLTFDDGPDPYYTPLILDILKKNNIKATFFVVGRNVARYPDIVKRVVEEGHSLGNHTYSHINMSGAGTYTILKELQMTQDAVDSALGYHYELSLVRPPWGEYDYYAAHILSQEGKDIILWQIDSQDWLSPGDYGVLSRVYSRSCNGGIILFHDTYPYAARLLQEIIDNMTGKGYEFLSVEELLYRKYNRVITTNQISFEGQPLKENGIFVKGEPYLSVDFISSETGIKFDFNKESKEVIFDNKVYTSVFISNKAFISGDDLVKDFGFLVETDEKGKRDFSYPSFSFDSLPCDEKAFIYKGEICLSLRYFSDITGIVFDWNSEENIAITGGKEFKCRMISGQPFISEKALSETGLLDKKTGEYGSIDLVLTEFVINGYFTAVSSYRDEKTSQIMVSVEDLISYGDLSQEELNIIEKGGKSYISLSDLGKAHGFEVFPDLAHQVVRIFLSDREKE